MNNKEYIEIDSTHLFPSDRDFFAELRYSAYMELMKIKEKEMQHIENKGETNEPI